MRREQLRENTVNEGSPSAHSDAKLTHDRSLDVHVWQPIETAPSPDFKQVFEFLTSIEGAGYGGMAEFEIARETMRRAAERT